MHIEKLLNTLNSTTSMIENEAEFFRLINKLNLTYQDVVQGSITLLDYSNPAPLWEAKNSQKTALINSVNSHLRQEKFSVITKSAQRLEDALLLTNISTNNDLASLLHNFIDAIDAQLENPTSATAFQLARAANKFINSLMEAIRYKDMLMETIAKDLFATGNDQENLKIFFPESVSMELFAVKTSALNLLIEECCNLVELSSSEAGVRINKIESGSYFAKISANPIVIIILTAVISNGATYIFNELDASSKIAPLRESSDVIEKLLNIRDTLRLSGHNLELLDENIKKSSIILSKQLEKLLDSSYQIQVNDTLIQAKTADRLQHQGTKKLGKNSDTLNTASSD